MTYAVTAIYIAAASAAVGAYSSYNSAQVSKKVAKNNAEVADINAADAQRRGELTAQAARRQTQQLIGTQRSSYAARGLDLGEGTPSDVIDQGDFFGLSDEATARSNAAKEAWALRRGGASARFQGDSINPGLEVTGSLLSSGSSVADKWRRYRTGQ